jgi:hypothetical protein
MGEGPLPIIRTRLCNRVWIDIFTGMLESRFKSIFMLGEEVSPTPIVLSIAILIRVVYLVPHCRVLVQFVPGGSVVRPGPLYIFLYYTFVTVRGLARTSIDISQWCAPCRKCPPLKTTLVSTSTSLSTKEPRRPRGKEMDSLRKWFYKPRVSFPYCPWPTFIPISPLLLTIPTPVCPSPSHGLVSLPHLTFPSISPSLSSFSRGF